MFSAQMRLFLILLACTYCSCAPIGLKPVVYNNKTRNVKYFQQLYLYENKFYMNRRYGLGLNSIQDSGFYKLIGDTFLLIYESGPIDKNWWPFTTDTLKAIMSTRRLFFVTDVNYELSINTMHRVFSKRKRRIILSFQGRDN